MCGAEHPHSKPCSMPKCRYEVHVDTEASRRSRQRRRMLTKRRRRNSQRIQMRKMSSIAVTGELTDAVALTPKKWVAVCPGMQGYHWSCCPSHPEPKPRHQFVSTSSLISIFRRKLWSQRIWQQAKRRCGFKQQEWIRTGSPLTLWCVSEPKLRRCISAWDWQIVAVSFVVVF